MRPKWLLLAGVLGTVVVLGALADTSLRARASAEREADDREKREMAQSVALLLEDALVRVEQSFEGEELVPLRGSVAGSAPPRLHPSLRSGLEFMRLTNPAPARAGFGSGLGKLDDRVVRDLLGSRDATPSGIPVAVVAAMTLDEEPAMRGVAERLFAGSLPVRPEDVAGVAASLGVEGDPRAAELAARLRSAPAADELPSLPAFQRSYVAGSSGSLSPPGGSAGIVEGWSRNGDERVRYRVSFEDLLRLARVTDLPDVAPRTRAVAAGAEVAGARAAVTGVAGLVIEVAPRSHAGPGLPLLRALLWGAVGLAAVAVVALDRATAREQRAAERERSFLGAVTHELRTPITSIRLLAETLEDGRGQPAAYGALVRGECERLEAMVEQVLDASRASGAPALGPVNPGEIVRGVATLAAPRAERRSVAMKVVLDEQLPCATWDAEAVRRALMNLVDNAIKHGRAGGRVEIGAVASGPRIELRVSDDGPGIKRQERSRIFERFARGETDAPGTGLGLYLVEQVARAHGGSVRVESVPEHGATFTLVLPVEPPASPKGHA